MHNERSNAIGLDQDLEVIEVDSKERNGRNDKKELKKLCFSISHEHAKNLHSHMKWNKKDFGCSSKGKSEN